MSFDPEFMRQVKVVRTEDAAQVAEEERVAALQAKYRVAYERKKAQEEALRQEFFRRGHITLATARTIATLAAEAQVPEDIEISKRIVRVSRWRRRESEFSAAASGWRLTETGEPEHTIEVEKTYSRYWACPENGPESITEIIPARYDGILLSSAGVLCKYHQSSDMSENWVKEVPISKLCAPHRESETHRDYPGEHYDRMLARFAIDHSLLPQAQLKE